MEMADQILKINNVIREILFLANSKTNTTIVIKSTVPVGTSDKIYNQIKRFNSEKTLI